MERFFRAWTFRPPLGFRFDVPCQRAIGPLGHRSYQGWGAGNHARKRRDYRRRPVSCKNVQHLLEDLERSLGIQLEVELTFLEMAEYGSWTMVLVDRVPHVIELLDEGGEHDFP